MELIAPQNTPSSQTTRAITKALVYCPCCRNGCCERINCAPQVKLLFWVTINRYRCCSCNTKFHKQVEQKN